MRALLCLTCLFAVLVAGCGSSHDEEVIAAVRGGSLEQLRNPSAPVIKRLIRDSRAAEKVSDVWLLEPNLAAPEWAHLHDLPQVGGLTGVHLYDTTGTDEFLQSLAEIGKLESLSLFGTDVTDAGLAHVAKLSELREFGIELTGAKFSTKGLEPLQPLGIKKLQLTVSSRTSIEPYKRIFPDAEIVLFTPRSQISEFDSEPPNPALEQ